MMPQRPIKNCPKCGKQNSKDTIHCEFCGVDIEQLLAFNDYKFNQVEKMNGDQMIEKIMPKELRFIIRMMELGMVFFSINFLDTLIHSGLNMEAILNLAMIPAFLFFIRGFYGANSIAYHLFICLALYQLIFTIYLLSNNNLIGAFKVFGFSIIFNIITLNLLSKAHVYVYFKNDFTSDKIDMEKNIKLILTEN